MIETKVVALRRGTFNSDLEIVLNYLPQDYSKVFFWMEWPIILITGIDRAENFTLKTWTHVLIGRPNVGEERSYPILIYQSKNNMG